LCCLPFSFAMDRTDFSRCVETIWNTIVSYSKDFSERNLPVFIYIHVVITSTDMTQLGRHWLLRAGCLPYRGSFLDRKCKHFFIPRRMALGVTQPPNGWIREEGDFRWDYASCYMKTNMYNRIKIKWDYVFVPHSSLAWRLNKHDKKYIFIIISDMKGRSRRQNYLTLIL
jgi:hypothetical protein